MTETPRRKRGRQRYLPKSTSMVSVLLYEDDIPALDRFAAERQLSRSAVIRDAIAFFLATNMHFPPLPTVLPREESPV